MSSVLQIKNSAGIIVDVPALRGKSAYQHAIEGGLDIESEELFNKILGNLYQIEIAATPPSTDTSDKIITIVLEGEENVGE